MPGASLTFPTQVSSGAQPKKPTAPVNPTISVPTSNAYLSFYGEDLGTGKNVHRFQALAGENPPTITAGYAKWQVVDRPLMRSVTIFQGYEPAQMKLDLIFGQWNPAGGWEISDTAGRQNESDIRALDEMAGSAGHYGYTTGAAWPQVVFVASYSTAGGMSDLIPPNYQFEPYSSKSLFPWVVSTVEWGTADRNTSGYRIYQEASLTLMQYLDPSGPAVQAPTTKKAGGWFVAKPGRDTALLIASAPSTMSPQEDHKILAQRIIHASPNKNLKLRSINQSIKPGKKVWVPSHVEF